jgi:hypothetical protein
MEAITKVCVALWEQENQLAKVSLIFCLLFKNTLFCDINTKFNILGPISHKIKTCIKARVAA